MSPGFFFFFGAVFCLQMGGCCANSTALRLISSSGVHISEHGLAILFDIWNKLYYTRHIKYNWMDHLTGICFKNSHSSAFSWLSWSAGGESAVPRPPPASLFPLCLRQSGAPNAKLGVLEQQQCDHVLTSHFGRQPWCQAAALLKDFF